LRSAADDTAALRLRVARELQGADLTPPALPPAAVLVVRQLTDPLPGRFGGDRLRPPTEWERAVRDTLAGAARTAARPDERGRLPAAADAVLFTDESELLACLFADRVRGQFVARWWWKSILRRLGLPAEAAQDAGTSLEPFLRVRPRELPAAIARLVDWGDARPIADAIKPSAAIAALASLAQVYSLSMDIVSPPASAAFAIDRGQPTAPSAPGDTEQIVVVPAPWSYVLPSELADMDISAEVLCLIGVALSLHVAPGRLRSTAAIAQARRWWHAVVISRNAAAAVREVAHVETQRGSPPSPAIDAPKEQNPLRLRGGATAANESPRAGSEQAASDASSAAVVASDQQVEQATVHRTEASTTARSAMPAVTGPTVVARVEQTDLGDRPCDTRPTAFDTARTPPAPIAQVLRGVVELAASTPSQSATPSSPDASVTACQPMAFPDEDVTTELGGILYLIHALQDMAVLDAFDPGWGLAANGGAWGALDLVARALLGSRFATLSGDPMWNVLAQLSGRPMGRTRPFVKTDAATPGRASDPSYRIPSFWLPDLDDSGDRRAWTLAGGRAWVWSEHGYLVSHYRSRTAHPKRERATRRAAASIPWMPPSVLPAKCPPRLGRWAAAVAPAIRRRLLLALGADRDDAIIDMLAVQGRLFVTPSHIDLVMKLDRVDLALRRAGLDRDPGWLPAYGRVVCFHFE